MRALLVLALLWLGCGAAGASSWRAARARRRRDVQLRRLLGGDLVPFPRAAADELTAPRASSV